MEQLVDNIIMNVEASKFIDPQYRELLLRQLRLLQEMIKQETLSR